MVYRSSYGWDHYAYLALEEFKMKIWVLVLAAIAIFWVAMVFRYDEEYWGGAVLRYDRWTQRSEILTPKGWQVKPEIRNMDQVRAIRGDRDAR